MDMNDYQLIAESTSKVNHHTELNRKVYAALGLAGEAGEAAEKVKKWVRGDTDTVRTRELLKGELGDVLWYVAKSALEWGLTLEEVAQANIDKVRSRNARGVVLGSGDER